MSDTFINKGLSAEAAEALCEIVKTENCSDLYVFGTGKGSVASPETAAVSDEMVNISKSINETILRNHGK